MEIKGYAHRPSERLLDYMRVSAHNLQIDAYGYRSTGESVTLNLARGYAFILEKECAQYELGQLARM